MHHCPGKENFLFVVVYDAIQFTVIGRRVTARASMLRQPRMYVRVHSVSAVLSEVVSQQCSIGFGVVCVCVCCVGEVSLVRY